MMICPSHYKTRQVPKSIQTRYKNMCFCIKKCFWYRRSLETRSKIIAIIALLTAICNLIIGIVFLAGYGDNLIHNGITLFFTLAVLSGYVIEVVGIHATIWLWILLNLAWMAFDVLLIYGILNRRLDFLLSWLIAHLITLMVRNQIFSRNFSKSVLYLFSNFVYLCILFCCFRQIG